jgi:hypothetical protein
MSGYLTGKKLSQVLSIKGARVSDVDCIYWQLAGEDPLREYVILQSQDSAPLVIRVGSTAEDIDVVSLAECEVEMERRGRSSFSKVNEKQSPQWSRLIDQLIDEVVLVDAKGYGHSSLILKSHLGGVEITTGVDALDVVLI